MEVGIEALNAYGGQTYIDVRKLFEFRGLDLQRFDNLMMNKKSVGLPCEDPVTNGVNAAKPIIDSLSEEEKGQIELLITSTESGLDFGKSLSTYLHDQLGLGRKCRLFEIKQACYAGTAALQMAANFVCSKASRGAKAVVVSTDVARAAAKNTYAEPSQGMVAVAMLVSEEPVILELDFGANGYYGYEIMDSCRPEPDLETGDYDLSLLSYLDCLEGSYNAYADKVGGVDFQSTFNYLAFHTPFVGMVKGAHRNMMRKFKRADRDAIDSDFQERMKPSLAYCSEVGNGYSASLFLALCGLIDYGSFHNPKRVGLFSYGSGCCSEFYSGVITERSQEKLNEMKITQALENRYELDMAQYEKILDLNMEWMFGVKDKVVDVSEFSDFYESQIEGKGLLVLKKVKNYHREYCLS
ncbi:hydroxymethylglutaryl-CoA synthase [Candidatus Scalindua japonica]|uniref:Hydroxymethylglutaryl-CoA synthase n=1 Tax=Candidatus Scalindua japonica TaxID=1284222 RepID=A0A286TTD9_9BACT|nr:hydroxymethylglutaryl-CoA synthase [Candidatus Scalindua japonica]GAX59131.1 hydroxymethylglutaryl-CoA synthase [Candidatus Scalindua japonica]